MYMYKRHVHAARILHMPSEHIVASAIDKQLLYTCICLFAAHANVYVCVYVYIYTYIHTYIPIYIYIYIYIYTHTHTHTHPPRLEAYCTLHENIAQRLALEKRLLYRTNMDMDEAKLKRIEIQSDTATTLRTCAKQQTALQNKRSESESELAKLENLLRERNGLHKDKMAHLDWKKEQNVIKRDRLRRQLTQL
jgi:hypothetical protein